jgi:hypothetical protein
MRVLCCAVLGQIAVALAPDRRRGRAYESSALTAVTQGAYLPRLTRRSFGRLYRCLVMSDEEAQIWLEGVVHASRYDPNAPGKQFLGAAIVCNDARVWVIDYEEQSPFHVFAGRQVVVSGEPYRPGGQGQYLIRWKGSELGHFRVSRMRPVEVTGDVEFVEVGAGFDLSGRFDRATGDAGESTLVFISDSGDTFVVANDPAGARVGPNVKVWAHPVQPSPSIQKSPGRYLWIICPYSAADLWAWRDRRS